MGVFFNDPDVDLDEIFWYNELAIVMNFSLLRNEELIYVDKELNTRSCYVELHRKGLEFIQLNFKSGHHLCLIQVVTF